LLAGLIGKRVRQTSVSSFLIVLSFLFGCMPTEATKSTAESPPHHTPDGFRNPHQDSDRGFGAFLRWQLGLGPKENPPLPPEEVPSFKPASTPPDLNRINHPDPDQIQITWLGHSTFLIQVEGTNILTDPVFSDRVSPFSFGGLKRLAAPGLRLDELPRIHAAVISHNHYDHLDAPTIDRLGHTVTYFVPLGLGEWLSKRRIEKVLELDWWQSSEWKGIRFHSVPIQHFSGRGFFDRNKTLWSGWIIESKRGKIFFAGDTGYSPVFKEIGDRFKPIRVSIIPIGAYRPRWFMRPVHVDPPEAIMIHKDTLSERSIASHWGTFKMADEPPGEPPLYLRRSLKEAGVREEEFILMNVGETLSVR
jgi:N-acyl-phosphatidylethanolamine-hydrolysing phospholipase D